MAIFVPRFVRQLRDVLLTAPADGEVLTYDSADEKWKNEAGGGGGGAPTTADYLVGSSQAGLSNEIIVGAIPGGELGGTWASPTVDVVHSGSSHAAAQTAAEATAAAALAAHLAADVVDGDAAGGVLAGTYPNPGFVADMATQAELDAHTEDPTDAHDASAISSVAAGNLAATNVQSALNELDTEKAAATHAHAGEDITSGTVADARIAATIARDSEVTSAVSASEAGQVRDGDPAGGVLSGTYPSPGFAVDMATQAELDAHLGDAVDAHDASAVSVVPFGTIAATQVQAALEEIVAEASGGVTDHGALTGLADDDHSQYPLTAPAASARNVIQPTGAAVIPLTLKAAAAQSADLLPFQNSSGVTLSHVDSAGRLRVPVGSLAEAGIGFLADPNTGIFSPAADQLSVVAGGVEVVRVMSSGRVGIGLGGGTPNVPLDIGIGGINAPTYMIGYGNLFTANSGWMQYLQAAQTAIMLSGVPIYVTKNLQLAPTNAQVVSTLLYVDLVGAATAAWTGFKIRGAAAQSESLQEWHTSADAILGRVNKDGYFMTRKIAAPADADVATSELAFWFDNTNGAGKAMFKGKTADGTVVTGSVALA